MITNKFTALQEEWLQKLESGEYVQTRDVLCRVENGFRSYCCLGVACEVYNQRQKRHKKKQLKVVDEYPEFRRTILYDGMEDIPPRCVCDAFKFKVGDAINAITELNDDAMDTFEEIASEIRNHPYYYFTNFELTPKKV